MIKQESITTEVLEKFLNTVLTRDELSPVEKSDLLVKGLSEMFHPPRLVERPNVPGWLFSGLEDWMDKRVLVDETAPGEMVKELYSSYVSFCEGVGQDKWISKKLFGASVLFLVQVRYGFPRAQIWV